MKINELRIGNIIKVRDNGKWNTAVVTCLFPTFIIAKNRYIHLGNTYDEPQMHGALLDEDWLYDNDFHVGQLPNGATTYEIPGNDTGMDLRILAENDYDFSIILVESKSSFSRLSRVFSYFHDLQNIYFNITGNELFTETEIRPILAMSAPIIDTHTESEE